jgi:hypothetical protein
MDANDVALFLKENPKFFEDYADVIAEIFVPHPHGGHAIPIAERQILTLREKNSELEDRLREMMSFGSENDRIGERLHRSTLALIAAPDLETTLAVLYHSLKEDFCPSSLRRARSFASTPIGSVRRIAARSRRSSRGTGSMPAPTAGRLRSCRCAPRTPSGSSAWAMRTPSVSIPEWVPCT